MHGRVIKKYILIASILLTNNVFAQLIIGDLKIEPTEKINEIKITNVSNEPVEIKMNGYSINKLQPNKSLKTSLRSKKTIKNKNTKNS